MNDVSLRISDLTIAYERQGSELRPIDGLNESAADGELVLLLGPSGCGKTTLLSCLAGLLTPTEGNEAMTTTVSRGIQFESQGFPRIRRARMYGLYIGNPADGQVGDEVIVVVRFRLNCNHPPGRNHET